MPDVLTGCMSRIPESGLLELAGSFSERAELMARTGSPEAAAWADVFSVLALSAESALLARRCGVTL